MYVATVVKLTVGWSTPKSMTRNSDDVTHCQYCFRLSDDRGRDWIERKVNVYTQRRKMAASRSSVGAKSVIRPLGEWNGFSVWHCLPAGDWQRSQT